MYCIYTVEEKYTILQTTVACDEFGWCSEVFRVTLMQGEAVVMGPFTSPLESHQLFCIQAVLSVRE